MTFPLISPTITIGNIIMVASGIIGTIIVGSKLLRAIKELTAPIREHMVEHDVMWEDYNLRTGGKYRRDTGRGNPPEPSDWHRDNFEDEGSLGG